MENLVKRAGLFAHKAHEKQTRRHTGEPYAFHCERVAEFVRRYFPQASDDVVAAAWLHDVVEDTPYTLDYLRTEFGNEVARLVYFLTNDVSRENPRPLRSLAYSWKMQGAPVGAVAIKLADILDNVPGIAQNEPDFARRYIAEKQELIKTMVHALHSWDVLYIARLFEMCQGCLDHGRTVAQASILAKP